MCKGNVGSCGIECESRFKNNVNTNRGVHSLGDKDGTYPSLFQFQDSPESLH